MGTMTWKILSSISNPFLLPYKFNNKNLLRRFDVIGDVRILKPELKVWCQPGNFLLCWGCLFWFPQPVRTNQRISPPARLSQRGKLSSNFNKFDWHCQSSFGKSFVCMIWNFETLICVSRSLSWGRRTTKTESCLWQRYSDFYNLFGKWHFEFFSNPPFVSV